MAKTSRKKKSKPEPSDQKNGTQNLYKSELHSYRKTLKRDLGQAYKQYGFTMLHSLDAVEKVQWLHEIGFVPVDEIDFYNLGTAAAIQEDYQQAKEWFRKALKIKPDMPETIFNLAVCHERLNNRQKAIGLWEEYSKLLDDTQSEELKAVKDHLETLKEAK